MILSVVCETSQIKLEQHTLNPFSILNDLVMDFSITDPNCQMFMILLRTVRSWSSVLCCYAVMW
jgi:hypothetical protein